jgi:hypothetical protein
LSQKAYLEKILNKYNMHVSKATPSLIQKGDKFGLYQCPRNQYEIDQMKAVPYASAVVTYNMHKCALTVDGEIPST